MSKRTDHLKHLSLMTLLALNTFTFASEEVISLNKIDVVESNNDSTTSYTVDSMNTATKLNLSVKATPQTITVITKKELEDRDINSYNDVVRDIVGVGLANVGITNLYTYARGFGIEYYKTDGVPYYNRISSFDMSLFDRVEIVKGANGLMTGEGNPSLSMNFIRKHANSKNFKGSVTLDAGSWDAYGQTTDITAPLSQDKKIRARVVAKNAKSKYFYDNHEKENNVYYGIIDGEINDQISFSMGTSYQEQNNDGAWEWGMPAFYSDGTRTDFSRSTSFAKDWSYQNSKINDYFGTYKHYIYEDISLNVSASRKKIKQDRHTIKLQFGTIDKTDGSGITVAQYKGIDYYNEKNLDTYLDIPFEISNLSQEIIVGGSYNEYDHTRRYKSGMEAASNIFTYDGSTLLSSKAYSNKDIGTTKQMATYLVGRFSLSEKLKFISGLRVSTWKYHSDEINSKERNFNQILTPYAGLVYDLNKQHSAFLSYTDIFKTQNAKDINEEYLDPIVGRNYEAGIKSEYLEGKVNTTFSVYRILQDNVAEKINGVTLSDGSNAYEAKEGVVSKGFEFSIAGQITDNINTTFGIANFEAKDADGKKVSTEQARTTSNLFVNYQANHDLNLGIGLKYYSKVYDGTGSDYVEQKAYTLVDLMTKYQMNEKTSLQLNIKNLFDKKYYEGIGADTWMVYGEPRNFNVSLRYTF